MKLVTGPRDVPTGHHFAIEQYETQHFTEDGGHGYGVMSHNVRVITKHVTEDKAELQEYMRRLIESDPKRKDLVAYEVSGCLLPKIVVHF